MFRKSITKIILTGLLAAATVTPTMAKKMPNACSRPEQRCTVASSCNKDGWCKVLGCFNNKTVELPFSCNEKAGGCLQKHC